VAANLAVFATDTDTVNSLRSPSASNSLFSFRPTRGLTSRAGVIPISFTQDAVGAMARTVQDLALAMTIMAGIGYDSWDNATASIPPEAAGRNYVAALRGGPPLRGLTFGLIQGFFNSTDSAETAPVNEAMAAMVARLEAAGVKIVNVTEALYNATAISPSLDVQAYEYRELLNEYLAGPNLTGDRPATCEELYASGKFLVIPSQYSFVNKSPVLSTPNPSYFTAQRGIQDLTSAL
jgi:Asp-tRNA(Asn)/Glu-tRNA(Gln) amidotransferase A subunit family amidase